MKQLVPEWWDEAVTFLRSDELLSGAIERYGTCLLYTSDAADE